MTKYQTNIYIIGNMNRENIFFISNNKINIDNIGNKTPNQLYLTLKLLFSFINTATDITKKDSTVAHAEPITP